MGKTVDIQPIDVVMKQKLKMVNRNGKMQLVIIPKVENDKHEKGPQEPVHAARSATAG